MNLKEQLYQAISRDAGGMSGYRIAAESCEKICDKNTEIIINAILRAGWMPVNPLSEDRFWRLGNETATTKELLTNFKENK